ncbi:Methyltransferase domain-containing protein [Raineyella antarctica]|uniref:Methyltransferase domain-containing protein n=1 Tax=Raineyella antarctica TaxID=1577474 RepID=A0A1G6GDA9_9ACTN|nr:class I SAM-dependent methyltransferase [Raineyella antarctica]SDB79954.1 Methyltransferase domain-containing protein [Raineyella antarctica]
MNEPTPALEPDGQRGDEPWETSWSERRHYDLVAAMLPNEFYGDVFDPACGTGELSAMIAARSEYMLATDLREEAVRQTLVRLAGFNADVFVMDLRDDWPERRFDLIVLHELLPFLDPDDVGGIVRRAVAYLVPDGHLVIGHGRRSASGGANGDEISVRARSTPGTRLLASYQDPDYVIDVLGRDGPPEPDEDEFPLEY